MVRQPAVAGRFYPGDAGALARQVDALLAGASAAKKTPARACVVPHAGYIYSGGVAAAVYARLEPPRRAILLGPRHYPRGEALAILSQGAWLTPLGEAQIDAPLAAELRRAFPPLQEDAVAHSTEHALEVQLPFLQRLGDCRFVPIVLGPVEYDTLEALGRAVAHVVATQAEPVLVLASTDMNHYEPDDITRVKDAKAVERIVALDARGLYDTVRREDISMCGYAATVAAIVAARELGATSAELVRYATSADASGDREAVVGYAGLLVP